MKAWIDFVPWQRRYEIRLAKEAGPRRFAAAGIDTDGHIAWEETDDRQEIKPFLHLDTFAFEALMRAAGEYTSISDATVNHLKDAVSTRNRLLVPIEEAWGTR